MCDAASVLTDLPFERIELLRDAATGLHGYIAIHSTARGPAFGGCRLWVYQDDRAALRDAMRLAEGMSYKNALAGLPFGGGKAVIVGRAHVAQREELFRALGRAVEKLNGRYITAEDVGTTPDDMQAVRMETQYVSGIPRLEGFGGEPSRFTALGVFHSIQVAMRSLLGRDGLKNAKIAVQGAGAVGSRLCAELAKAGAELWVADNDPAKTDLVRAAWNAHVVSNEVLMRLKVDVLAPCAVGAVLNASSVERVGARIVAGAANNQLALLDDGDRLHARGIWYLPDFLINAGGIIAVAREYLGTGTEMKVLEEVARMADRVEELIETVQREKLVPARAALSWAKARMSP